MKNINSKGEWFMKQCFIIIGIVSLSAGLLALVLNSVSGEVIRTTLSNISQFTNTEIHVRVAMSNSILLSKILMGIGILLIVFGTVWKK
nr:hypothetical protein [uncultured Dysosmobacter sp.]